MLVRDYLKKALYDTQKGYFSRSSPIMMNEGKQVTNFSKLQGKNDWIKVQSELFQSKQGSGEWLTQCELFAPHFSSVLVDYVYRKHPGAQQGLNVIEIGGGSGTNALHFLDSLKERYPDVYSRSKYTLCEISPTMASLQLSRVSGRHQDVVKVHNADFLDWNSPVEEPTIIIAMEVLDNLPHDKLTYTGSGGSLPAFSEADLNSWREIVVEEWGMEKARPLADALTIETAKLFLSESKEEGSSTSILKNMMNNMKRTLSQFSRTRAEKNAKSVFIPSGSVKLLKALEGYFPHHLLIAGDFSYLPFGDVEGSSKNLRLPGSLFGCKNAPIVSGVNSQTGQRQDFPSYILQGQNVDVFFQTDFGRLAKAYTTTVTGGSAEVKTTYRFLDENVSNEDRMMTTTIAGYNPMLEDFENVSFLLAERAFR